MSVRLRGGLWAATMPPPPDWLVEGLLCHPNKIVVAGESGAYKSWFLPSLALHLCLGKDWLDFKVPKRRKVLYINEDMPTDDMQARFAQLCAGYGFNGDDLEGWLFTTNNEGLRFGLNAEGQPQKAAALMLDLEVQKCDPDVVIMEVLLNVANGDISRNNDVANFYRSLLPILADNTGHPRTIIISHHFTKYAMDQDGKPIRLDLRALGGAFVKAGLDGMLTQHVVNEKHGIVEVQTHKLRRAKDKPKFRFQLLCDGLDMPARVVRYHGPGDDATQPVTIPGTPPPQGFITCPPGIDLFKLPATPPDDQGQ